MWPTYKTDEYVLEATSKVEELICIFYDVCNSDPREIPSIDPVITFSSDGTGGLRSGVGQVFDEELS